MEEFYPQIYSKICSCRVFHFTTADADIGSLKSLHTFLNENWYHMLEKFEQNCIVRTAQNFKLFDSPKKNGWPFLIKRWRHFERRFCCWNNCLMLNNLFDQCSKNHGSQVKKNVYFFLSLYSFQVLRITPNSNNETNILRRLENSVLGKKVYHAVINISKIVLKR